jgi:hypothetical protein
MVPKQIDFRGRNGVNQVARRYQSLEDGSSITWAPKKLGEAAGTSRCGCSTFCTKLGSWYLMIKTNVLLRFRAMTRKSPRNRIHGVFLWIIWSSHIDREDLPGPPLVNWLVVDLPLWKIRVKWDYCSQYLEQYLCHVPKHQPNKPMIWIWPWHSIHSSNWLPISSISLIHWMLTCQHGQIGQLCEDLSGWARPAGESWGPMGPMGMESDGIRWNPMQRYQPLI